MADILIRGVKMPKHCSECFVKQCKNARYYVDPWPIFGDLPSRPGNCPLVALPGNHGPLIDASKLMKHYAWWGENDEQRELFDEIIDQQETIVPAEEEDT